MFGLRVSDMKVNAVLPVLFLLVLLGCTPPMEKSVLEQLTSKELDRVAGKDISFLATYSIVEDKSNYIHTPQDSSRWKPITYSRLHSYLKSIESAELNSPLFAQLRGKWERMYNSYNAQVDSILNHWNGYLSSNAPDSLLRISFEGVEMERIRNKNKQIDTLVKAKIKFKTLRFPIDSFSITYCFSPFEDSSAVNTVSYKRRIKDSSTIKVFPALVPDLKKALAKNDSSLMFKYEINSLYSAGKCYNLDSLKSELPKSVQQLISAEETARTSGSQVFDELYFREKIIRELVDPGFISQSAYIKINAEDYYRELDSLVFNYTNLR